MSFSQELTDESNFSQTKGVTITAGIETEAKIPFIGGATLSLSTEVSKSWSYGGSNSVSKTWAAEVPVEVPAGKVYNATIYATSSAMNIPYTGTAYF